MSGNPFPTTTGESTADGFNKGALEAKPESGVAMQAVFRERSTLEALFAIARSNPRDEKKALDSMLTAAKRTLFAEDAEYRYERGKKFNEATNRWEKNFISGVSVYATRPIATYWGNMDVGWTIVEANDETYTLEGYAIDMQNGRRERLQYHGKFVHQRKIDGETRWVRVTDERDRREIMGKQGAILTRNCVTAVVPPDIIDAVVARCRETNLAAAALSLTDDKRKDTVAKLAREFEALKVTLATIETHLGHPLATISPEELAQLKAIWRGIVKEGKPASEYFDIEGPKKQESAKVDLTKTREGTATDPAGGLPITVAKKEEPVKGNPFPEPSPDSDDPDPRPANER